MVNCVTGTTNDRSVETLKPKFQVEVLPFAFCSSYLLGYYHLS